MKKDILLMSYVKKNSGKGVYHDSYIDNKETLIALDSLRQQADIQNL
jgi:hypothetical protein